MSRPEPGPRSTALRDTLSAFSRLAHWTGRDLAEVPATPEALRHLLDDLAPGALDVSGLKAVLTPVQGYYVVGPRLLGELASLVSHSAFRWRQRSNQDDSQSAQAHPAALARRGDASPCSIPARKASNIRSVQREAL